MPYCFNRQVCELVLFVAIMITALAAADGMEARRHDMARALLGGDTQREMAPPAPSRPRVGLAPGEELPGTNTVFEKTILRLSFTRSQN